MKNIFILKKLDVAFDPQLEEYVQHITALCNMFKKNILENENQCDEETLILSLGGDGTMLYACGLSSQYGSHVVGINLGNLGFLTPFTSDFLYTEEFKYLLHPEAYKMGYLNNFRIMKRDLLSTRVYNQNGELVNVNALNEFVLTCKNTRGILQYTVDIIDRHGNCSFMGDHTSSGIVISTPTGSTAYSLNIGGCIISPDANVLQLQHISPASMSTRPIVLGNTNKIVIGLTSMKNGDAISLRKDGQEIELGINTAYTFVNNCNTCSTIIPQDLNHFKVLSQKLGWNKHYI